MLKKKAAFLVAAVITAATYGPLHADDTLEYKGYLRVGKAWQSDLYGYQGDFGMVRKGGQMWNGRLGQEADQQFLENTLVKTFTMENGSWAKFTCLFTLEGNVNSDNGDYVQAGAFQMRNRQTYVEMGGFSFAPDSTIWAGKRFLNRDDIYVLDWYFLDFSGTGFGLTNIAGLGIDAAFVQYNKGDNNSPSTVVVDGEGKGKDVSNTAVLKWETSLIRLDASYTRRNRYGDGEERKSTEGYFGSAMIKPRGFFLVAPGNSKMFAQYAHGASAENIWFANRVPNSGDNGDEANDKQDAFSIGIAGLADIASGFSIAPALGYIHYNVSKERSSVAAGNNKRDTVSRIFGVVRPHYNINRNVALELEAGYFMLQSDMKSDGNGGISNFSGMPANKKRAWELKITPAVCFTLDENFYTRPSIRLYANYEQISANQKGAKNSTFSDKTSLISWGFSSEAWW